MTTGENSLGMEGLRQRAELEEKTTALRKKIRQHYKDGAPVHVYFTNCDEDMFVGEELAIASILRGNGKLLEP